MTLVVAPRRADTYEQTRAPRSAPTAPPPSPPPSPATPAVAAPAHPPAVPSYGGPGFGPGPDLRHAAPRDPGRRSGDTSGTTGGDTVERTPHPLPRRTPRTGAAAPASPTDALLALVAEDPHVTGVLLSGAGAVHLRRGEVVHAESPAAPTLDALLIAGGRLTPDAWQKAVDNAAGNGPVARRLVEQHRVHTGELEICHLAALFDAAYFALAPDAGPVRFRPGVTHWLGPIRPVPGSAVARECRRRRLLLDRAFPDARLDVSPVLRRPEAPPPRAAFRRAILDLADGVRTPGAIAHHLGRPAYHVLVEVRRMAAAGLVAAPPSDAGPPADHHPPAGIPPGDPPAPAPWIAHAATAEPPDIELLRRIRDALEARL